MRALTVPMLTAAAARLGRKSLCKWFLPGSRAFFYRLVTWLSL
jgi:hypothetical protein